MTKDDYVLGIRRYNMVVAILKLASYATFEDLYEAYESPGHIKMGKKRFSQLITNLLNREVLSEDSQGRYHLTNYGREVYERTRKNFENQGDVEIELEVKQKEVEMGWEQHRNLGRSSE